MEISSINQASPISTSRASEMEELNSTRSANVNFSNEIDMDNLRQREITRKNVEVALKDLKPRIKVHDEWYHTFIGEDYITFKGNGKITFKELREKLGIPPRALSKTNNKNFKDTDVVDGKIEIKLSDIGWFERRMDEIEARDARAQRNYGNNFAGYERAVYDDDIISWLK